MEITANLVPSSVGNLEIDAITVRENIQRIAVRILMAINSKHNILLNVGDQLFIPKNGNMGFSMRVVVIERVFFMPLTSEKEERVHFELIDMD